MSAPAAHLAWAQVIARNIVPFFGIVFLGWSAASVLVLYFVDTLLSMAVLFAGVLRSFAPPITNDGLAARLNGEAGMLGGGVFLAIAVAIPLGVPLLFMLGGGDTSWRALLDDPALRAGIVWQLIAAFWSYVGLYRALRHATPEALRLKRRFALVFLRWMAMVMAAYLGVGVLLGRYGALAFVVLYAAVSIWSEIAPDRFLRAMPGGAEDADPAPVAARRLPEPRPVTRPVALHETHGQQPVRKRRRRKR
jgi:hypothetical protein